METQILASLHSVAFSEFSNFYNSFDFLLIPFCHCGASQQQHVEQRWCMHRLR